MTGGSRAERQKTIAELVSTFEITAQTELVELLADAGIEVTQATVSRDLEQLGIGKLRGADGTTAYVLPDRSGLAQLLRQFVTDITSSGNLAVLRTPPGAASTVASAIDSAVETRSISGILATLQGDDTVLAVAREPATGADVASHLSTLKTPAFPTRANTNTPVTPKEPPP